MKLESLEELRVYVQIAESGSLTAAARALGLPPNTVSRRLASLEDRLDVQLVYRTTRSLSLSEPGERLLVRAQRILAEVESAERALTPDEEQLNGLVRVSVPSVVSRDFSEALKGLLNEHSGLRVQLTVNDRAVNPVSEGLDVVVIGGGLSDSTLIARKLAEIHPVLAASKAYIQEHGSPSTPAELVRHRTLRFISPLPQTTWSLTAPDGTQHVVPVEGQFEADDGRSLFYAIAAGLGIGLCSHRLMRHDPNLVQVLRNYRLQSFPLYAIYPVSRQRSPGLQAVVGALQQALEATSAPAG